MLSTLARQRSVHAIGSVLLLTGVILVAMEAAGGADALRARLGWGALLATVPAHCVITISPIGEFVPWGLANGMIFGFGLGALLNWIAWMGATVVQFAIGRQLARDFGADLDEPSFPRWLRRFPVAHPLVLTCGRWFPMGASVVNTSAGARGVALHRVLGWAAVGCVPQAFVIAGSGAGIVWMW